MDIVPVPLPGLASYHVVSAPLHGNDELLAKTALRLGRELARRYYGDDGGFVVLFNTGAARRRPWPHAHVVAVRSVAHKRVVLALLLVKRWLRKFPSRRRSEGKAPRATGPSVLPRDARGRAATASS